MTIIRQPKTNFVITPSSRTALNTEQKILIVGQMLTGTATPGQLVQNIANGGAEDALFGPRSMLAGLVRANKSRNQQVQVDAIPLDDNVTATKGEISVIFAGSPTESGTLTVIVGSEKDHKYSIAISSGDSLTVIGDAVEAAITADPTVQATASNNAGTVTITAANGGTYGDSVPVEVRGSIAGLGSSVNLATVGATDPVLTGIFDVIGETRYQAIVWPYPAATTEVLSLLDARFNADGKVQDGVAFTAVNDTVGNLTTLASGLNSQSLVIFGGKLESETNYKGGDIVETPMMKASAFAGYRALRLDVEGFAVSDLVISSNGALDALGGPALASKPYFNTPFSNLIPSQTGRGFDDLEIQTLSNAGVTVVGSNPAGTAVVAGEVYTTYKTDTAGNADISFKFLNYVDTSSQVREYFYNNNRKRFAQSRLTEGDIIKGRDMANEPVIRSYSKRLYQDLTGADYVLLEAGETSLNYFDENLIISIDKALGKVSIQMKVILVTQYREIAGTIQIAFSTND